MGMIVIGFSVLTILIFPVPFARAQTQTVAPTRVDLRFDSDLGTSSTDNITSDNTPRVDIAGVISGATVVITATRSNPSERRTHSRNMLSGGSYSFTFPRALSDGVWTISATQRWSDENMSVSSPTLTITIDTEAPTITVSNPESQTEEATSRTFSAGDDESGTTTMKVEAQTGNTCAASAPESAESYTEDSDYVVNGLSNNSKYLCFWSEDVAGNVGKARSNQIQNLAETLNLNRRGITATPDTPDLTAASDSGVDNDDITNDSTPTFSVSGTVNGATVTVTATKGLGNTITGTATASGTSTNVTFTTPLSDGIWSVSATQQTTGEALSLPSSPLTVTIDTTAPTVTVTNPAQTEEATSRTFSAVDDESGTTTMEMDVQTPSGCTVVAPVFAASYTEDSDYVVTGLSNNGKYLCFWSEDVAGNVGRARSDQIQNLIEISATPDTPDLATASDSGVNNDNITNDSTPTFSVSGTVNGATVTVTATKGSDNTITGDATASGASTNVTLPTLSDGIWSVSATQTESGGKNESLSSSSLTVTIDTEVPTVTETKFYEDRGLTTEIAPGSYRKQGDSVYAVITFSENVGHVEGDDSSARPYIAYHISADSFYDIVGFNSNPLPDGDCQPNHATERNVYICRYDVESSINDTFTVKVSADTEDIAGNALASEYEHTGSIYLDTTSPDNLVVNSAAGDKKRVTVTVTVDRGNPNIPDEIHLVFGGDCTAFGEDSVSVPAGTQTGQSHTFTVSAPKGSYDNCTIKVVDGAGNETSDVTIPSFKVRGSSSGTVGGIRATSAPRFPGSPSHAELPSDTTALSRVETTTGSILFSQGQRDDRIRAMQVALNDTSCKVAATGVGSPGNESAYFGERTRSALACYQQQQGLPVTGNYDTATHVSLRQNFIRNRLIALFERYNRDIVDFFDEHDLDLSTFGLRRSDVQ